MSNLRIAPVRMTYDGVTFRSTLEADWAATLNFLRIQWQYEPEAFTLPSGTRYRPDFYLPEIATWLEVKGPHNERLEKTLEFARAVFNRPECTCDTLVCEIDGEVCCYEEQLVVVGRAPIRGKADWKLIDFVARDEGTLQHCSNCGKFFWYGGGAFGCRAHRRHSGGDDDLHSVSFAPSSAAAGRGYLCRLLPFVRAPHRRRENR